MPSKKLQLAGIGIAIDILSVYTKLNCSQVGVRKALQTCFFSHSIDVLHCTAMISEWKRTNFHSRLPAFSLHYLTVIGVLATAFFF